MNNKRYDDALKRAEAILKVAQNQKEIYDCITTIFPELKESDDEEVRGAIIHFISHTPTVPKGTINKDKMIAWLEKQEEQKETNLVEILKHYPKETELYSPLYGKLWLAEVDEKNEIITCYKHHLEKDCTRAVLEQEDTVSFYSNGTTGLPDFSVSKDCMLFLYDDGTYKPDEKQGEQKHKFIIGDIISNNNVIYRVDNIVKNCIGQDCYFLVNIEMEKKGIRYLILRDSEGKTSHMGEITWLCDQVDAKFEKQGEQKETLCDKCKKEQPSHSCQDITALGRCYIDGMNTSNKVESKFHEGEWITNGDYTWKIVEVKPLDYILQSQDGNIVDDTISHVDEQFHLWSIKDAKECDVLVFDDIIMIFKNIKSVCTANTYILYCDRIVVDDWCDFGDNAQPATKEQCDFLFKKMKEAGYEWDAEKKEPKKIELQPSQWNISDFRTWQHIVCDVLTKYWGIGQYLDDGFCKKIAQDMQEEWNKKLCLNQDTIWSEEDEKILDAIVTSLNNEYFTRRLETLKGIGVLPVVDWLKSIKERMCTKSTTKTNRFKVL